MPIGELRYRVSRIGEVTEIRVRLSRQHDDLDRVPLRRMSVSGVWSPPATKTEHPMRGKGAIDKGTTDKGMIDKGMNDARPNEKP